MKLAIKWLLIGLLSTLIILFILIFIQDIDSSAYSKTSHTLMYHFSYALSGTFVIIALTSGLAALIPTAIIALIGFIAEKIIRERRVGTIMK